MTAMIAGLAALAVLAVWYFGRKKVVEPPVAEPDFFKDFPDSRTVPEMKADDAARTAAEALRLSLAADQRQLIDQQAATLKAMEQALADAQEKAILDPSTPYYSDLAKREEEQTRLERAQYEQSLSTKLTDREKAMNTALGAADSAWTQYAEVYDDYLAWEKQADGHNDAMQRFNRQLMELAEPTLQQSNYYNERVQYYRQQWESAKGWAAQRLNEASRIKVDAVRTMSKADDCILLVQDTIDEIRATGLLVTLANRVDSVARATRTKLTDIESRMSALQI